MHKMVNNQGHSFTIVKIDGKKCIIQFENTGYTKEAYMDNVRVGKCKDPYEPSRYNVGFEGEPDKSKPYWKKAKQLWANMLKRCYTDDPKGYKWKGTTVDKRWHCFANFLDDISKLEGFNRWLTGGMNLDKDFKIEGNNVYSREACIFLAESLNKSHGARSTVKDYKRTVLKLKGKA